jgi:ubiquitin thioesterase OTU1
MQNFFDLRIRHSGGSVQVNTLGPTSSIYDLKTAVSKLLNYPISSIILKTGFPPKYLDLPESTTIENAEIYSGETILVEVDESKVAPTVVKLETKKADAQKADTKIPKDQVPNTDGMIMVRRIIPADNSCLFNSIAYALENKAKDKVNDLREVIAGYIMSDPQKYNEVVLEKTPQAYMDWILKSTSWGGAIELEILSKYYKVEICAIDLVSLSTHFFGQDMKYSKRIYVLYDGIHYDILARNISEDLDLMPDICTFKPDDSSALNGALWIAKDLHNKKEFTDVHNFSLECGVCYSKFVGEKDALDHGKTTGHYNFHEVKAH